MEIESGSFKFSYSIKIGKNSIILEGDLFTMALNSELDAALNALLTLAQQVAQVVADLKSGVGATQAEIDADLVKLQSVVDVLTPLVSP